MTKRMVFMDIGLMIVFGGIFGWKAVQRFYPNKYFSHYEPPPVAVSAAREKREIRQTYLSTIGNFTAVNGVNVSIEMTGINATAQIRAGMHAKKSLNHFHINFSHI